MEDFDDFIANVSPNNATKDIRELMDSIDTMDLDSILFILN